MIHKAWSSIEEVPYCFFWSSIKFQGHKGWKIDDLNPICVRLLGRSQLSNPSDLPCFKYGTCICYSMCICLTIHISYSVATACILCMISFSISYIYKYYLDTHRSPPVAHTVWCAERTKSAPTNAHQKRTYRCAPKAHLQVRTKSAPTGAL